MSEREERNGETEDKIQETAGGAGNGPSNKNMVGYVGYTHNYARSSSANFFFFFFFFFSLSACSRHGYGATRKVWHLYLFS